MVLFDGLGYAPGVPVKKCLPSWADRGGMQEARLSQGSHTVRVLIDKLSPLQVKRKEKKHRHVATGTGDPAVPAVGVGGLSKANQEKIEVL